MLIAFDGNKKDQVAKLRASAKGWAENIRVGFLCNNESGSPSNQLSQKS
jgi:hypothetical protein